MARHVGVDVSPGMVAEMAAVAREMDEVWKHLSDDPGQKCLAYIEMASKHAKRIEDTADDEHLRALVTGGAAGMLSEAVSKALNIALKEMAIWELVLEQKASNNTGKTRQVARQDDSDSGESRMWHDDDEADKLAAGNFAWYAKLVTAAASELKHVTLRLQRSTCRHGVASYAFAHAIKHWNVDQLLLQSSAVAAKSHLSSQLWMAWTAWVGNSLYERPAPFPLLTPIHYQGYYIVSGWIPVQVWKGLQDVAVQDWARKLMKYVQPRKSLNAWYSTNEKNHQSMSIWHTLGGCNTAALF
eukprot:137417-Chlamydomonas_euryale.AAC.9